MHRLYLVTLALVVALLAGCATVGAPERLTDGSTYVIEMPGERDGYRRSYRLHVPEGYRETETVPLVVVVHGAFSTSAEFEQHTGFSELADREGFIVAYPDGIGILGFLQHWNAGHCCGKAAADDPMAALLADIPREDISKKLTSKLMAQFADKKWQTRKKGCEDVDAILQEAKMRIESSGIGDLMDAIKVGMKDPNKAVLK